MGSKQDRNWAGRVKADTVLPSPVIGTGERTPETGQGDSSWMSPEAHRVTWAQAEASRRAQVKCVRFSSESLA